MKVIFPGSFNPVTNAHLIIAEAISDRLKADVVFVPVSDFYKKDSLKTTYEDRMNMLRLATCDNPHFTVSDIEGKFLKDNGRQAFTLETVRLLKTDNQDDIAIAIGYDNFIALDTWHEPEALIKEAKIIVYPRPDTTGSVPNLYSDNPDSFIFLEEVMTMTMSSSLVRDYIREAKSLRYIIPDNVIEYIKTNDLYKGG